MSAECGVSGVEGFEADWPCDSASSMLDAGCSVERTSEDEGCVESLAPFWMCDSAFIILFF